MMNDELDTLIIRVNAVFDTTRALCQEQEDKEYIEKVRKDLLAYLLKENEKND